MKNKKVIMTFSSLMIIIFHLWINLSLKNTKINEIETFIRYISFIGVDIFFFLSAYSLERSKINNYLEFIKSRFKKIYLKFIIFSILAFFLNNWNFLKLLKTITGLDLFLKGGGSFLWFIPAIMIIYLLIPLYKKYDNFKTLIITIISYLLLVVLLSIFNKTHLLIFINRIPIILIGYYFSKLKILEKLRSNNYLYFSSSLILLIFGLLLSYYIYKSHLNLKYFGDFFYLTSIPLVIGVILLLDKINTNKIFNYLGSITLEAYLVQMLFGYSLTSKLLNIINSNLLINILSIIFILLISAFFNFIFQKVDRLLIKNHI